MMRVAKHYLLRRTGTHAALYSITSHISSFCKWLNKQPDTLIEEYNSQLSADRAKTISNIRNTIDEYIFYQKNRNLSPTTINKSVLSINIFFKINDINLHLNFKMTRKSPWYSSRAITIEELMKLMATANLREKVIIGILAVSGLRLGTLVKLQYRHVKHDLERGITPLHIGIDPQITKGMYQGYSTFINGEVTEYLKKYLSNRRKGNRDNEPENINDDSPLIRLHRRGRVEAMSTAAMGGVIRQVFFQSGILTKKPKSHAYSYELGTSAFRKFFRTQMAVLRVEPHYIEHMMGHKNNRYLDVKMVGTECLRQVYKSARISLKPADENERLIILKQAIEKLGYSPEAILKPKFLSTFHKSLPSA